MKVVDVVVVGAGQAGLAASYYLTSMRIDHVVLERGRIGESWRSQRWDSFRLVLPNWTVRLPGFAYQADDPDGFMSKDSLVGLLEDYARSFKPNIRENSEVVELRQDGSGFAIELKDSTILAKKVVVATGPFSKPRVPLFAADVPKSVFQIHSVDYKNLDQLQSGGVLIVGTGQSGSQIAIELHEAGIDVKLCVSKCARFPRRYRGKDVAWWLEKTGYFDSTSHSLPSEKTRYACNAMLSGQNGGRDVNLRGLGLEGIQLLGRAERVENGEMIFAADLKSNLDAGDLAYEKCISLLNDYANNQKLTLPADTNETIDFDPPFLKSLDFKRSGVTNIIWSTGLRYDFDFIKIPVFSESGFPHQMRGTTEVRGLYFLGLPYLHKKKSSLLLGISEDAEYVVRHLSNISNCV
jgi:putative flavoprotein involved in K+ transport